MGALHATFDNAGRADRLGSRTAAMRRTAIGAALAPIAGERAEAVAERVIAGFGSLSGFLAASPEALDEKLGGDAWVGRAVLAARALIAGGQRETLRQSAVDPASPALRTYLATLLSGKRHEVLHVIFADRARAYIADETLASGGRGALQTRFRALFHRAFELGANTVVLAHNHPSGDPSPSSADILATREFVRLAAALDLTLLDHLVVARGEVTSMRDRNLF